jgi:hypothetical protein
MATHTIVLVEEMFPIDRAFGQFRPASLGGHLPGGVDRQKDESPRAQSGADNKELSRC